MSDTNLILKELQNISGKLDALSTKVDDLTVKVDDLAEQEEVTRAGVNKLIEWAEGVGTAFQIPFADAHE